MSARLAVLLALAALLGSAANAISPRGLSWTHPLGQGLRARIGEAGLHPVDLSRLPDLILKRPLRLLDARPTAEYQIGHLAGAQSCPWRDIEEGKIPLPPPAGPTVVYCSNEFCDDALRLARLLAQRG
ncbi:MAG TPA: rhodanese-like domain-containing protein, partial [Planctomycetota bacterium]|nr:rhodanese-like domain-containing protein [Planctomycetota bacterium]